MTTIVTPVFFFSWLDGEVMWYLVQSSGLRLPVPQDSERNAAYSSAAFAQQAVDAAWTTMRVPRVIEPLVVSCAEHAWCHEPSGVTIQSF